MCTDCAIVIIEWNNSNFSCVFIYVCVCVCVLVGLSRVYVLILSFVLSSWAVVGALWPYCPAHCGESLLFVIAVNAWFSAKCVCDVRVRLSVRACVGV